MKGDEYLHQGDSSSEFPPSYTEATSSDAPAPSYTSHLSAHLASLPSAIRNNQDSHLAHLAAQDADLLSLINPEIDALIGALLARAPSSRPPPVSATLVLVPAAAVPQGARYVHDDAGDEITRVARVSDPKGVLDEAKLDKAGREYAWSTPRAGESSMAREFSDWGRWDDDDAGATERGKALQWWWKDEDMATRLAGHLQPQKQINVDRRSVREAVEAQKQERRAAGLLGRMRSGESSQAAKGAESQSGMTVAAEEVTFRRENEMGIWESMTGWGIIVRLNVKAL